VGKLQKAKIPCAVMGGMAVDLHGHRRLTKGVDILRTSAGLEEFRWRFESGA
jgi:hypothetical protein